MGAVYPGFHDFYAEGGTGSSYFIIDHNSTNGVNINGVEIEPETKVELPVDSDLNLGRVSFRFVGAEKLYDLVTK